MIQLFCVKAPSPVFKGVVRDIRPTWVLEETGLSYEIKWLERSELQSQNYLEIHPFGRVPAIRDGEFTLFESGAICEYLAEKSGKLIPRAGTTDRHEHTQWVQLTIANLDNAATRVFASNEIWEQSTETRNIKNASLEFLDHYLLNLDKRFALNQYLMNEFMVADILLSCTLHYLWGKNELRAYPHVCRYLERNWSRPAGKKAFELNGGR